jgi:hypothetical protein
MTKPDFDPSAALEAAERKHAQITAENIRLREALEAADRLGPRRGHSYPCACGDCQEWYQYQYLRWRVGGT